MGGYQKQQFMYLSILRHEQYAQNFAHHIFKWIFSN